jgi:hypothetical protein
VLFVELKGHVGLAKSDKHSPEQRSSHADCAVVLLQQCATVANTDSIHMQVTFTSFDPSLLRAVRTALEQSAYNDSDYISVRLGAIRSTPAPLAGDNAAIDQFDDDVNMVTVHPHWMRQADYEAFKSRGWELGFWMFSSVPETYDAINRYQPRYVTTNEAQTLTRWLER